MAKKDFDEFVVVIEMRKENKNATEDEIRNQVRMKMNTKYLYEVQHRAQNIGMSSSSSSSSSSAAAAGGGEKAKNVFGAKSVYGPPARNPNQQ